MITQIFLYIILGSCIISYVFAYFLKRVKKEVDGDNEIVIPVIKIYSFLAFVRGLALLAEFITLFFIDPNEIQHNSQRFIIAIQIILTNFSWICYCLSIIFIFDIIIQKFQGSLEDNNKEQLSYRVYDRMIEIGIISILVVFFIIVYPFMINNMEEINYISFQFDNDVFYYSYILSDTLNWILIGIFFLLLAFNIYQMVKTITLRNRRNLIRKTITHRQGRFYPAGLVGEIIIIIDLSIRLIVQQQIRSNDKSYMITLYSIIIAKLILEAFSTPFIIYLYWDILSNVTVSIQETIDLADSRDTKNTFQSPKPSNIKLQFEEKQSSLLNQEESKSEMV